MNTIQSTGLTLPLRVTPMNNPITLITSTVAGLHFCCTDRYMRSSANFRIVFSESQNASPLDAELGPDFNGKRPFKFIQGEFDTVDHPILLHRLTTSYGFNGVVHMSISSYLTNRTQYVRCPGSRSTPLLVLFGVPQGSVLGLLLFLLYTADLVWLVESFELCPHLYADDTQIYGFCRPGATDSLRNRVADCRCCRRLDAFQLTST